MAKSKTIELKQYLSESIDDYIPIELDDNIELWDNVIDYLSKRFNLQYSTIIRIIPNYINCFYYRSVPQDIFIDMKAKDFIDNLSLEIENVSWHRIIDTNECIDYCRYYDRQIFWNSEFDVPDYYDIETFSWIIETIERTIPNGFWIENGEGSGSDLFVCHNYDPDMFIESMEIDGEYITDKLYIDQICSE